IRIEYDGPPTCPSADAFFAEVAARTRRARRATDGAPARTFIVAVRNGEGGSTGHLAIRALGGSTSEGEAAGDTGEGVGSAVALSAAPAVDPSASTRAIEPTPAPSESPPPPPPPAPPATAAPLPPERPEPDEVRGERPRWHLEGGVHGTLAEGVS